MANEIIILQIMLITVIVYFSRLAFYKLFGQTSSERRELFQKIQDMQNRLNEVMGDADEFGKLQKETIKLMKQMMIKQIIPMCISCITFLVLWIILGIIYAEYSTGLIPFPVLLIGDGWGGLYIMTSLGLFVVVYLIKFTYRKIKGIESPSLRGYNLLSPSRTSAGTQSSLFSISTRSQVDRVSIESEDEYSETEKMKKDAWKEKIK